MGPFKVLACTAPNTYRLAVPPAWRAFDEFNVDRLKGYLRRPPEAAPGADPAPSQPPIQVKETLRSRMRYGRPHVLVRWEACDGSRDAWVPVEALPPGSEADLRAFERVHGAPLPRPRGRAV